MGTECRNESEYRFFLLRLWSEGDGAAAVWRCSLEDPATRARRGFDGIETLGSYLAALCRGDECGSGSRPPSEPGGAD